MPSCSDLLEIGAAADLDDALIVLAEAGRAERAEGEVGAQIVDASPR